MTEQERRRVTINQETLEVALYALRHLHVEDRALMPHHLIKECGGEATCRATRELTRLVEEGDA